MTERRDWLDPEILGAYVDDELDASSRAEVARRLAETPDAFRRVQSYKTQNDTLNRLYGPVADEPVPDRLLRVLRETPMEATKVSGAPPGRPPWVKRTMALAMTAGVALAVGLTLGWQVRGNLYHQEAERIAMEMFLHQATNSYSLYASEDSPWREGGVQEDRTEFASWFRERMNAEISTPEFDEAGFEFVGGRALPAARGSAGQMLYRDADNRIIAIYFESRGGDEGVRRAGGGLNGSIIKQEDTSVYYWQSESGGTSYAMIGAIDRDLLASLAESILEQFGN
ncbi:MAG: anti-sigma factor [Ectothiorhodospiraceae bacterium]|nr:anti-sigma factor [Ectothiorhodospiraceae bacterium]